MRERVAEIMYIPFRQLLFSLLKSPEPEAFVDSDERSVDENKSWNVEALSKLYEVISHLSALQTGNETADSFMFEGGLGEKASPSTEITNHFVDSSWWLKSFS